MDEWVSGNLNRHIKWGGWGKGVEEGNTKRDR